MELPKEDVVLALESIVDPVSLYEPVYSDGGDTIYVMDQVETITTIKLAGRDCFKGGNQKSQRSGKTHFISKVFQGYDTNRGVIRNRDKSGSGQPS